MINFEERVIEIDYTNWRGVRRKRKILPLYIWFGTTLFHVKKQWLVRCVDMEETDPDKMEKDFAIKDIHNP